MKTKENKNTIKNKEQKTSNWSTPKRVKLPKEINDFLLKILKEHNLQTAQRYRDSLINTEKIKEDYWSSAEAIIYDEEKGQVVLIVKANKMRETSP